MRPSNGLQRPAAASPRPTPAPPTPVVPTPAPSRPSIAPSGGIVRPAPAAATPSPVVVAPRQASASPVVHTATTFDSGLTRTGGLARPANWDHRGVPVRSTPYCPPPRVVHHYGYGDYPWRTTTHVTYHAGACAPRACYPLWPYTTSPFYGSSLRGVSITYSNWCGPTYVYRPMYVCPPTYWAHCPTTHVVYPPPIYGHRPAWGSHVGFSYSTWGSSSSFGLSIGWGLSSCTTWRDPRWSTTWCGTYVPARHCPSHCYGWWHRPTLGWSTYSVYSAPVVVGIADAAPPVQWTAAPVNAVSEFEEAVYSTMRGEYQTAIRTMRNAVLGAPESFAPGAVAMDEQQLQRAAWAMTVYRNPPQRAVQPADAAFMVAALAALSGDGAAAAQAAEEARQLGDRHPATERLAQMIQWAQSFAD
ncbi:MAG: hypothetical protein KF699_07160 [Phycisphaeraceae bacterium]|nr:hypothetical protein [Phycisphaeraceae bacterium]